MSYEQRVSQLEREGLTTSDAQAVADAEEAKGGCPMSQSRPTKAHASTWKYVYDVMTVSIPAGWEVAIQRGSVNGYGVACFDVQPQDGQLVIHLRQAKPKGSV